MEKNTKTNPQKVTWKKTKIGCLVLLVLLFVGMCTANSIDDNSTTSDEKDKTTNALMSEEGVPANAFNKIMPSDIYLNYEEIGFETNHSYNEEAGHLWTSTRNNPGIKETLTVYSRSTDYVENAQVTVMLDPMIKKPEAAYYSFRLMVRIPFEGNSDEKSHELQQWIGNNINKDKAETTCGDVKFIIHAPTNMVRMLTVEKNRE